MKRLKTAVVTASRADYGLLYPLIKKMIADDFFDLHMIVTGSHLSAFHGDTVEQILKDGFDVRHQVRMTLDNDSENHLCQSIALGITGFSQVFQDIQPDLLIILGDRYELWSVCPAAVIHKIPIAHIHGGEVTSGVIDDSIRHSVTKMAAIHFPTIDQYGKRIIQMGEEPKNVFIVGALGIDNIHNMDLMDQHQLSEFTGVDFYKDVALMTYHPVTLDGYESASVQVAEVLNALLASGVFTLITMPNADTGGKTIFHEIQKYVELYPEKFKLIKSLGQCAYLSGMKFARVMVGNSSSGIIESASFRLPVVNIGDRQGGRYKPKNIIDCDCTGQTISDALKQALSKEFKASLKGLVNPYGDGQAAQRIVKVLKSFDFNDKEKLLKKGFYDLD